MLYFRNWKHKKTQAVSHTCDPRCYLLYFPAPWTAVKIKPHQPAITDNKISDKQGASEQESVLCLLCGFCWRLSSHSNTESKPERQMSAKSDRSNTLRSLFIENQDLSCSFTEALQAGAGSQWLYFYYINHTHTHTHTHIHTHIRAGEGLWSLCVCTGEQYVVIRQSWKGILNPCASLYNRLVQLILSETLENRAHDPVDFFCLIHWNQFTLSLKPALLILYSEQMFHPSRKSKFLFTFLQIIPL